LVAWIGLRYPKTKASLFICELFIENGPSAEITLERRLEALVLMALTEWYAEMMVSSALGHDLEKDSTTLVNLWKNRRLKFRKVHDFTYETFLA